MFNNYKLKRLSSSASQFCEKLERQKSFSNGFHLVVFMFLLAVTSVQAQTQRIPSGDGTFSNGPTFAANGWTVANQGVSPVKWAEQQLLAQHRLGQLQMLLHL